MTAALVINKTNFFRSGGEGGASGKGGVVGLFFVWEYSDFFKWKQKTPTFLF